MGHSRHCFLPRFSALNLVFPFSFLLGNFLPTPAHFLLLLFVLFRFFCSTSSASFIGPRLLGGNLIHLNLRISVKICDVLSLTILPKMADLENSMMDESFAASEVADDQSHGLTASATVGTRRQANGTIGSVYSGNKIRHLKKEDGIPLWRKDIQYQFLKLVFEDKTPVFTRYPDGQKGMDFADLYINAMARSSKTSKILKDKLQNDKPAAINMAMVCLLVNFGRMNTTLNCTPCGSSIPSPFIILSANHPVSSLP
jgi:hypothetical protein